MQATMQNIINLQELINKHENRKSLEERTAAIAFFEQLRSPNFGFQKANSIFKCNRLINRFLVIKSQKANKNRVFFWVYG